MSSGDAGAPQDPAHIEDVDVDQSVGGDGSVRDLTTDSGLEINSSGLADDVASSKIAVLAGHAKNNDKKSETKVMVDVTDTGAYSLSSSGSSSPANTLDLVSNFDELSASQQDDLNVKNPEVLKESIISQMENVDTEITMNNDNNSSASNDSLNNHPNLDTNKTLATSTVSLNDTTDTNVTINKCPYSRSAENISIEIKTDQGVDKDAVLSQFKSQKSKASATQAIPDTNANTNLDVRYTRIPKELLSQDLGSIVKNVHGIFSSVSGSLKNAYTHRANIPYMKTKAMPNGKVMSDIFEDEHDEKITNGIEHKIEISDVTVTVDASLENGDVKDVLRLQTESLERVLAELRKENAALRETVKQQGDRLTERDQTFRELETKMDLMSKRVEQAEREKDAAVMRYASVERAAIEARRAAEQGAARERASAAEAELAGGKLRAAREDKQRICQLYDDKCHELSNSERELAKVREEVKELEGRLKWTQSKLRMEMDAYKDSAERVEKLTAQVAELEAAAAGACDSQAAKQMETELKESMAALILCRHERESLERRLQQTSQQLETTTRERDAAVASNASNLAEMEKLREHNVRLEMEAAELAPLRAQAALADTLSAQLHRETERAAAAEEALGLERARAETCARREAAALEHAARLTARHVAAQQLRQHTDDQVLLHGPTERAAAAEEALGLERARAETCARREAAALEHAARLTARHVAAQQLRQHTDDQVLLHGPTERAAAAEEALGLERARAETCARREAAALEHAARLTARHVAAQQLRQHTDDQVLLHGPTERAAAAEEALGLERARAETCARREAAALEHAARLTARHVAAQQLRQHTDDQVLLHGPTERAAAAEEALGLERARAETCARREAAALEHAARLTARHVAAQQLRQHTDDQVLLHGPTERAAAAEEALGLERARAETCARREAAALEHAARLTARHVAAQQLRQHTDDQTAALSADNAALRERITELEAEVARLQTSLTEEAERRLRESRVLARKVAELQEEASESAKQLEWEKGENGVLKKKHASQVKELNRELARALKRVEALEAKQTTQPSTRTGSVTSLSSGEGAAPDDARVNGHEEPLPDVQVREPDRQALVERIVSLQRAAARRAERCDFLEEHARQLTDELRAKSRLLRHLLPNLPAQALSSTASDSNKKEIAKFGGGAMAALWGGDTGGLSLELSLEMNKRLQSVLEDTLLKNITLKENMDTLGEEIARLKSQKSTTTNDKK